MDDDRRWRLDRGLLAGNALAAARYTGDQRYRAQALALTQGLKNRAAVESVFKSFPFYFGGVLGAVLFQDQEATDFAIAGAGSLAAMYNPVLKLIPLGAKAEEGDNISNVESSIDSLHTAPFLLWAAEVSGDKKMRQIGRQHEANPASGRRMSIAARRRRVRARRCGDRGGR